MGTIWDISLIASDGKKAEKAADEVFDEIKRLESVMSLRNKESELCRLNNAAGKGPVKVSDDILKVLSVALKVSELSGGSFDVSIGPVVALWGFAGGKEENVPARSEIDAVHALVGYKQIFVDSGKKEVTLKKKGMILDFGGIGKGYALDRAALILSKYGLKNYMLSAGGQILAAGRNFKGKPWRIGVRHPRNNEKLLTVLNESGKCIATSGDYEHFFIKKNKIYHHIFNPASSKPVSDTISVTVVLDSGGTELPNTLADALSTAVFVMGSKSGTALMNGIKGAESIVVSETEKGTGITVSESLKNRIEIEY